ncbi:MAG: SOS response-associated peptidase [Cyanobacteria bacterium J06559_3]
MCGRFSQTHSGTAIAEAFQLSVTPDLTPRYNIAPTQAVSVVTQSRRTDERVHHQKRWGLVPKWAKDIGLGNRLINARAETVATKPAFRTAFQRRRCLVVTDGFYEWQRTPTTASPSGNPSEAATHETSSPSPSNRGPTKQPFFIQLASRSPFAFAGLWERWQDPETSEPVFSCTILTIRPNDLMASIHHRMPVILPPEAYEAWLDPSFYNPGTLESLLRPYDTVEMTATPISTAINNPRNDSERVQQPC